MDDIIPVSFSADLVKKLQSLGADVKFTVYPYAGHDSWTETYLNPELYKWFLSHRKNKK
jgi:predicted esterase